VTVKFMKPRKRECDRVRSLQKILVLQVVLILALLLCLHPASSQNMNLNRTGALKQNSASNQDVALHQNHNLNQKSVLKATSHLHAGPSGYVSVDQNDPREDGDSDSQSEPCEEVARELAKFESVPPQGYGKTKEQVKDIAILTLQLEEVRLKYARFLQLNAEGVTAANTLQTARAGYERVQVQLAGKVNNVRAVLNKIIQQRKLANDLQKQMAVAFGRKSHDVAEVAPAKKPAPSELPGKPPQAL